MKSKLNKILHELQYVNELDNNPNVTFSGYKRMVYGLWNNGCNESNHDMIRWLEDDAKVEYKKLIEQYKNTEPIVIKFSKF